MKLILTEAEKKAATWAELNDAALGKAVKSGMFQLEHISDEKGKLYFLSAAILLCSIAVKANTDKLKQTIRGLTIRGEPCGNWEVVISKTK